MQLPSVKKVVLLILLLSFSFFILGCGLKEDVELFGWEGYAGKAVELGCIERTIYFCENLEGGSIQFRTRSDTILKEVPDRCSGDTAYDYSCIDENTVQRCSALCEPEESCVIGACVPEEVLGCTDPDATNYNPDATVDDGSCEYPPECIIPTDGMVITEDTTFCAGEYELPSGISIGASEIELDCNGARLTGDINEGVGISVNGDNNNIENCRVRSFQQGFLVTGHHNNINSNTIRRNQYGMDLYGQYNLINQNNIISNIYRDLNVAGALDDGFNTITNNEIGGAEASIYLYHSNYNEISLNTITTMLIIDASIFNDVVTIGNRIWNNNFHEYGITTRSDGNLNDNTFCVDEVGNNYHDGATGPSCVEGIPGCTDPGAFNYNEEATVNDGSCEFSADTCVRRGHRRIGPSYSQQIWTLITPVDAIFNPEKDDIAITEINFEVSEPIYGIWMRIFKLDSFPETIEEFSGIAYQYLEIETRNLDVAMNINIEFEVENSWLEEHGLTSENIALFRYDGSWNELPTSITGEGRRSISVRYTATSPGFSYFVIGEK